MGPRPQPRSPQHQGRVTSSDDDLGRRPPRRALAITAWLIVGGLVLAVVAPVLLILFG